MKVIDEKDIKNCAGILMKNTDYVGLRNTLNDLVRNGDNICDEDIYSVVEKICLDGYDISGFGLRDIPHQCIYTFHNVKTKEWFNVYLDYFNDGDDYVTIGYIDKDNNTHDAENIKEAIQKYAQD